MINKNTEFVTYIDNFLDEENLLKLQTNLTKLDYKQIFNKNGDLYGMRHVFTDDFKNDPLLKDVKKYFFPHRNLKPVNICAHIRNNTKEPLFHTDEDDGQCANFLFFVKGDSWMNNGTGFAKNNDLSAVIGFVENRAVFFNGAKIKHGDMQPFGDSSARYTLNVFYKEDC